jgi:hypothetical protein
VVRVGTSKGSTISLWLQYIRGISYRGPTERKKERKTPGVDTIQEYCLQHTNRMPLNTVPRIVTTKDQKAEKIRGDH